MWMEVRIITMLLDKHLQIINKLILREFRRGILLVCRISQQLFSILAIFQKHLGWHPKPVFQTAQYVHHCFLSFLGQTIQLTNGACIEYDSRIRYKDFLLFCIDI